MATIVASPPTSAEPDVLLFDLAAGDGEEDAVDVVAGSMVLDAGPRFFIPLLGPGRRGGGMVKTVEPPLRPGRVPGSNMLKTLAEDLEIGELLDHDEQVACLLTVSMQGPLFRRIGLRALAAGGGSRSSAANRLQFIDNLSEMTPAQSDPQQRVEENREMIGKVGKYRLHTIGCTP